MEEQVVRSISDNPLLRAILSSQLDTDLVKLIMTRTVPFTEMEYLEVYVYLLRLKQIRDKVSARIRAIPNRFKTRYLHHRILNFRTAYYLLMDALIHDDLERISTVVHHKYLPPVFLEKIALRGSTDALELLMENQQAIIKNPGLLQIIRKNPNINTFIESSIKELEELFLAKKKSPDPGPKKKIIPRIRDMSDEDLIGEEEDFEIMEVEEPEEKEDLTPAEREALKKEEEKKYHRQVSTMSVPEKLLLAKIGSTRDRLTLVKDGNKIVSGAVLDSPKLNESEVSQIAANRSLDREVISGLAKKKKWHSSYKIVSALAVNPKTPVNEAMAFTRKLTTRDLRLIAKDRNTNPVIRNFARQLIQTKQ